MWRQNRSKACLVIGVNKELESTNTLHLDSRRGFLKRIASILITIVTLVGAVFFVYNFINANAAAPTITNISPDNGPIAGGTNITITGTGFKGEYERVEALVFDGNSYIDTGIDQRYHYINARFQMNTSDSSTINMVFGNSDTGGSSMTAFGRTTGGVYNAYRVGTTTAATTYVRVNQRNDITLDWSTSGNVHINGTTLSAGTTPGNAANIWIGRSGSPAGYYRGYFYSMRTYDSNNNMVMDSNFVPVRKISNGEYGMVNTVTGTFHGNAGSGTISGGSWNGSTFVAGQTTAGAVSPDRQIGVLINDRVCTGLTIISNTELTCNTPSGLSLGQEDVVVRNTLNLSETTTVPDGFEYALRLNSVYPKSGEPNTTTEIEIDGGVFSTPPEQYESVDGIIFDGSSWIETGFNQVGTNKYVVTFRNDTTNINTLPTGTNVGFLGSRPSNSNPAFVVWQATGKTTLRTDYNGTLGVYASGSYPISSMSDSNIYKIDKDNTTTTIYDMSNNGNVETTMINGSGITPSVANNAVEMLLGSLSHGGAYGTSGTSSYSSFMGTIYSAQICKDPNDLVAVPAGTIYQIDDETCGAGRALVRDFRAAKRNTDGVYGFYDMVTGAFFENDGFGVFTPESTHVENELEVPLELRVDFTYTDGNNVEQTGVCANPELVNSTKVKCTMPISPLPEDGQGRVDLTVYANDVEATSGTADANDFYYGSPMVVETISPNRGPTAGWQTVTITGNNFHPSLNSVPTFDPETDWGNIVITIGGSVCNFELDSNDPTKLADTDHYTNTSITCMTTSNPGGISDIEVTLDYFDEIDQEPKTDYYFYGGALDPITGAITSGYLYEGDLISVSPNIGPTTGGTVVTITGNGFVTDPGITTQVFFGNVAAAAANITVVSYTEIRVTAPRSAITGIVNVTVVQTGQTGYAASFTSNPEDGFEYEFVTGTGTLTPNQAYTTGGDTVLLTGTFDSQAATVVTLTSGTGQNQVITTLDSQDINVLSDTQIEIIMPAHNAGIVLVTVNQHNTDIPIANLTYINPLTITSITPNVGPVTGGTIVTIAGTSFIPIGGNAMAILLSGKLDITIGGESCAVAMFTQYTNTSITCTTSARTDLISGLYDVVIAVDTSEATEEDPDPLPIINPNHTDTLVDGYRYVDLSLSLNNQTLVDLGTISITSPYNASSTEVRVTTDNPTGYNVFIMADDSDTQTTDDNQLKCLANQTPRFQSIASADSPLLDNTWGYNITSTKPAAEALTWQPITTSNVQFSTKNSPSGPLNNGQAVDTYITWFGAKTSATQPPCTYSTTVVFTAVAKS